MASNYTTNYQLNQWEPTDQVQRVEFNQDNAKVDAALSALTPRVGLVSIRSWEVAKTFRTEPIDFTDFNWTAWKTVIVDIFPAAGTSTNVNFCYSSSYDIIGRIATDWTRVILTPYGRSDVPVSAIFWGASNSIFRAQYMYFYMVGNMQIMGEDSSDQVAAGTQIIIRGEPA